MRAGIPKGVFPHSGDFPWMVLATVGINLLALALPLLMLQVFDRILPHRSLETLALLAAGTALAVAAEAALRLMRSTVMVWAAARFEHGATCGAVSRLLAAPAERVENAGYAERFRSIGALKDYFSGQRFLQLIDLPFATVYLVLVAVIGGWIVLVPLVGAGVFALVSFRFASGHTKLFAERGEADRRRSSFLVETLTGIHTVKAMAMEGFMLRRYERLQETCAGLTRRLAAALDSASGIGSLFAPLMTVLIVAAGGYLVIRGGLTNGELAACIMLVLRACGPLQRAASVSLAYRQTGALREEIAPLFQGPALEERPSDTLAGPVAGRIELRGVSYCPPDGAANLIDDVSLVIEPGEAVVIQGSNGTGHSTLLRLMAGLLAPSAGEVLLDGTPMAKLDPAFLRSNVAFVPEGAQLFQGTILDNITGFEGARTERALDIASAIGLDRYVGRLAKGWNSPVGAAATETIPVGHRQRIAMVRALSCDPRVILFDAASVSMDAAGDAALRRYLESQKGRLTLVMVTHRPSLASIAQRILTIDGGRLVDHPSGGRALLSRAAGADEPAALDMAMVREVRGADTTPESRWERTRRTVMNSFGRPADLAVCLPELLRALQWRGEPRDLAEALPYYEQELDISGLLNCMSQLGWRSGEAAVRLGELDARLMPCLFLPEGGPALVLLRREQGAIRAFDSRSGEVRDLGDAQIFGRAYFFTAADDAPAAPSSGWTAGAVRRMRPLVGQAMASAVIFGLLLLPVPLFVMMTYAHVLPSGSAANLAWLTAGAIAAVAIGGIFIVHRSRILSYIAGRLDYVLGTAVFKQILALPPSMSEGAAVGAQVARLASFEAIRDVFTGPIAATLLEAPAMLALIIALGILNPAALLVVALTLAIYALLYLLLASPVDRRVAELSRQTTRRHELLVETISKLRAIAESGGEAIWMGRLREVSAAAAMAGYRVGVISAALAAGGYLVTMLGTLAIILVSIVFAVDGAYGIGVVIASMMLGWRVVGPVQTLFVNLTRIDRVRNAATQVDRLMSLRGERPPTSASGSREVRGRVEFERVSFRYSLDTDPALIGVSFTVEPGRLVAVTGPNGGGKSTLLKLMAGIYQPQAGSVRIDETDLRQIDPLELRRGIGYVPQENSLFHGTIAQNLRLVRPAATDAELQQALAMAGVLNDIALLPEGIDTRVGDGSTARLALSLRQKISLARAYLTRAPILLFDEPAGTLDADGDRWFMQALHRLKRRATVFLVTHRPSHIRLADHALVLEGGYVRISGTPDEALQRLGVAA